MTVKGKPMPSKATKRCSESASEESTEAERDITAFDLQALKIQKMEYRRSRDVMLFCASEEPFVRIAMVLLSEFTVGASLYRLGLCQHFI
jgi:hypothetical protein